MSPSSVLFGGLFIGFIVYVVMKGELSQYGAVLWGPVNNQSPTAGSTSGSTTNAAATSAMQPMQAMQAMGTSMSFMAPTGGQ